MRRCSAIEHLFALRFAMTVRRSDPLIDLFSLNSMVDKDAKVREMRRENLLLTSKIQLLEDQMENLNDRVDRTLRGRNHHRRDLNSVRFDSNLSIEVAVLLFDSKIAFECRSLSRPVRVRRRVRRRHGRRPTSIRLRGMLLCITKNPLAFTILSKVKHRRVPECSRTQHWTNYQMLCDSSISSDKNSSMIRRVDFVDLLHSDLFSMYLLGYFSMISLVLRLSVCVLSELEINNKKCFSVDLRVLDRRNERQSRCSCQRTDAE